MASTATTRSRGRTPRLTRGPKARRSLRALPAVNEGSSGSEDSDDKSGEDADEDEEVPKGRGRGRAAKRRASRASKPKALTKHDILQDDDPDNEGLQWLKKRGEYQTRMQNKLSELQPVEKALKVAWKKVGDDPACDLPKPKKE